MESESDNQNCQELESESDDGTSDSAALVSSIWDKLVGLESKFEKVQNENVKLKQEKQNLENLMHTQYFRTDELDQYSSRENVRIFGIP